MPDRLGFVVPELVLEAVLREGMAVLDSILDDDAAVDAYLERAFWNLPATSPPNGICSRAQLKAFLREREIAIVRNYPRKSQETPCWVIILGPSDGMSWVGNVGARAEVSSGSFGNVSTEGWASTVGILTMAEQADQIILYHQLAKFFIAARRRELSETFEMGLSLSERDFGFMREFEPRFVYSRRLDVRVEYQQLNAADLIFSDLTDVIPRQEANYAGLS